MQSIGSSRPGRGGHLASDPDAGSAAGQRPHQPLLEGQPWRAWRFHGGRARAAEL